MSPRPALRLPARGSQFIRFALVGGGCFALNVVLLYVCKEVLHLHYFLASALALLMVSAVGFLLNRRLTFRVQGMDIWRELGRYYAVNLGSFTLNLGLMVLLVELLKLHYLVANVLVGIGLMVANFWLHKNWSFGKGSGSRKIEN